jgi:hypothetical protein
VKGFARLLRGELVRAANPAVIVTAVAVAAVAAYYQLENLATPYPPPSGADWAGSVWISSDQLSSLLGWCLGAVIGATTTALDLESGALALLLIHEPRRLRFLAARFVAGVAVMLGAGALMALVVRTATAVADRFGDPSGQLSAPPPSEAAQHVAGYVLVACAIIALATLTALLTRSQIATFAATTSVFAIPLLLLNPSYPRDLFPSWWVVRFMAFSPYGYFVDYLAGDSPSGAVSLAHGLLIAGLAVACLAASLTVLIRAQDMFFPR